MSAQRIEPNFDLINCFLSNSRTSSLQDREARTSMAAQLLTVALCLSQFPQIPALESERFKKGIELFTKESEDAIEAIFDAALKGHLQSISFMNIQLLEKIKSSHDHEFDLALSLLILTAKKGDPRALCKLGQIFTGHHPLHYPLPLARLFFALGALKGDPAAFVHYEKLGGEQLCPFSSENTDEKTHLFKESARLAWSITKLKLAPKEEANELLKKGLEIFNSEEFDQLEKGIQYIEEAKKRNCIEAYTQLSSIYLSCCEDEDDKNFIIEDLAYAAFFDDAHAYTLLGEYFFYLNTQEKQPYTTAHFSNLARIFFKESALQGDLEGCYYFYHHMEEVDVGMHFTLTTLAAHHGNRDAQYDLGCRYLNGDGVESNKESAVQYLNLAAQQGHQEAKLLVEDIKAKVH